MEMHQLRYFVAAADSGSFTRAAERCFVTQPSLSQQIIKLENELGAPLFDRGGRHVRLTDAGRRFYDRATEILAAADSAKRELTAEQEGGRITVGVIPTIAPYLLPPLLRKFLQKSPQGEVGVYEAYTALTLRSCLEGDVDVGILALPIDEPQLVVEPLFTEELLLAMASGHRLARKRSITMEDLAGEPFVLLDEAHCLGEQIVSFCKQKACLPAVSCHSAQLLTVQELVAAEQGISLIPKMAVDADKSRRRIYRSLAGERPSRTIAMIWRKNRYQSPLVRKFVAFVRSEVGKAPDNG